jgi:hypothetical protein
MKSIIHRESIPGTVFFVFVIMAAWILSVQLELWWLSLVLIVVGAAVGIALRGLGGRRRLGGRRWSRLVWRPVGA